VSTHILPCRSLDLAADTYQLVRSVEPASTIIKAARSSMVTRLNSYASDHKELFTEVLRMINAELMHIIKRQALTGSAIVRSNNPLLERPVVVNMVLDVLAERGYSATLDIARSNVPERVLADGRVVCRAERTHIFRIDFPRPQIRRNE
jgi:adenylate kinase